jgi:hypothetical protein
METAVKVRKALIKVLLTLDRMEKEEERIEFLAHVISNPTLVIDVFSKPAVFSEKKE